MDVNIRRLRLKIEDNAQNPTYINTLSDHMLLLLLSQFSPMLHWLTISLKLSEITSWLTA